MKVDIAESAAAGALQQLSDHRHPDVRHLVKELKRVLHRDGAASHLVTADEFRAVLDAIDVSLVSMHPLDKAALRSARPKIVKLMDRQKLREKA